MQNSRQSCSGYEKDHSLIQVVTLSVDMAKKLGSNDIVSVEEVLLTSAIEQEALINLLVKKGLIDKREVYEEINKVRKDLQIHS